jgi:hypothetical protein
MDEQVQQITRPEPKAPRHRLKKPIRSALVVIAIALAMGATFVTAYTVALGRPTAHRVPLATVGPDASVLAVIDRLETSSSGGFEPRGFPDLASARAAVDDQEVLGIVDTSGPTPVVYVCEACSVSGATAITRTLAQLPADFRVRTVSLHQLPANDPNGISAFYATIGATILGLVVMFQIRANAHGLSLREWCLLLALNSVCSGLVLALVSVDVLHALAGTYLEIAAILAAQTATVSLFLSTMLIAVHRWAIVPTWLVFIVFGNTSSGGAVAPSLLPVGFAVLNRVLPSGGTVSALRSAVYFPDHQHLTPFLTVGTWLLAWALALALAHRLTGRIPPLPA